MRKLIAASIIASSAIAGTTTALATEPPSNTNDPELAEKLLTIDDFPAGWAIDTTGEFTIGEDDADECAAWEPFLLEEVPTASQAFTGGGSFLDFNIVMHAIADIGDDEAARGFVDRIPEALESCSEEGTTAAEMSFPDLGDATFAVRITAGPGPDDTSGFDFTLNAAAVFVAVDQYVTYVFGIGKGSDGELLEELATTAVERLH